MSLRPVFGKPNFIALGLATVAMVLIYVAGSVVMNSIGSPAGNWIEWLLVSVVSYIASGVVAGCWAKRSPLMHGALLGVLVMGMFAGIQLAGDPSFSWTDFSMMKFVQQSIIAMIACSIGAFLGDRFAGR